MQNHTLAYLLPDEKIEKEIVLTLVDVTCTTSRLLIAKKGIITSIPYSKISGIEVTEKGGVNRMECYVSILIPGGWKKIDLNNNDVAMELYMALAQKI